ncbi:MAG: prenyltransferase, partial [Myxococcales bacterium]|nr:prenyltransferase [Myxococcales bacterium]
MRFDLNMWARALTSVPRIDADGWARLDPIGRWLIATRAAVFVMTAISCGVGGILALRSGHFDGGVFLTCLLGLVFAHATNNLVNDLTDHVKGVDRDNYFRAMYGPQPLEHGLLTRRQMYGYIAVTGLIALIAGIALVLQTGTLTLALFLAGCFFVLLYTWPLKYLGLGEPSVTLVWGPLMIGGTYHVTTGGLWDWGVIAVSLIYALGPTTVLMGKHTDKLEQDRAKGIRTLPVLLGEARSRACVIVMWWAQYVGVFLLTLTGQLRWPIMLVLLSLPSFVRATEAFQSPRPRERPREFPEAAWPLYLSAHA